MRIEDRGGRSQNAEQVEDSSRSVASTCTSNMAVKCMQPGAMPRVQSAIFNFVLTSCTYRLKQYYLGGVLPTKLEGEAVCIVCIEA